MLRKMRNFLKRYVANRTVPFGCKGPVYYYPADGSLYQQRIDGWYGRAVFFWSDANNNKLRVRAPTEDEYDQFIEVNSPELHPALFYIDPCLGTMSWALHKKLRGGYNNSNSLPVINRRAMYDPGAYIYEAPSSNGVMYDIRFEPWSLQT